MSYLFSQLSVPAGWTSGVGRYCQWSPSGDYLLAASQATPFVKMFNRVGDVLSSGTALSPLPTADTTMVEWAGTVDQSFAAYYLASSNYTHTYTVSGGAATKVSDINGYNSGVNRYSPDGQWLLLPYQSPGWMRIFKNNPVTGLIGSEYGVTSFGGTGVAPNTTIWDMAFSHDNTRMVLGTPRNTHTVQTYDVTARDDTAHTIAFNNHGYDNTFILTAQITCIKFHPSNNRYFIVCSTSATSGFAGVHLYDMGTSTSSGTKKIATLTGQSATEVALNAEWSADGTMLLAAFAGTLAVWDFDVSTATFSNKATQTIASYSTSHRCSLHKVDGSTSYAAVAHSTSATNSQLTFWKITNAVNLNSRASIPKQQVRANLGLKATVDARAKIPTQKVRSSLNSYVQDFPSTQPYRLLSQVVVAPGDGRVTFAPFDGDPSLIDATYPSYGTSITGHEYLSANIGAVYSGYEALIMDQHSGTIDAVYAGYEAAIDFSNPAWALYIDAQYPTYGADLEASWPFGALIDAQYPGYEAFIDGDIPYGYQITAGYAGYQALIDGDIPQGEIITAQYGPYSANISAKQVYINSYIFADYPTYGAAIVATRIPAIAAVYPTYQVDIDGDVGSGFAIGAVYPTYSAALDGDIPLPANIAAVYPTYGAAISARGSYLLDANVRYPGYSASLYMQVPTVPGELAAVYPTYGAEIITHYYQPEYIEAVYTGYVADLVGDIGKPIEFTIDAVYQSYQASLNLLLYEPITIDAVYPGYGADIELQYVPKRKRQIYLVQPV